VEPVKQLVLPWALADVRDQLKIQRMVMDAIDFIVNVGRRMEVMLFYFTVHYVVVT